MTAKKHKAAAGSARGRAPDYETVRESLESGGPEEWERLAADPETVPEILHYIAENGDAEARRLAAAHPSTPRPADEGLARDDDDDVRAELARKIARMVPDLDEDEVGELREWVISLLERLADDRLPRVRRILSEELCRGKAVPKSVILKIARDLDISVAAPMLEYSPLLDVSDLREIVAAGMVEGAAAAIARRRQLDSSLVGAIVATLDIPAIRELLLNAGADIREQTMLAIVDAAEDCEILHKPLALRPNLSVRVMMRISGFVAAVLVERMVKQSGLDEETGRALLARARNRIAQETVLVDEDEELAEQARTLVDDGLMDDDFVLRSIRRKRRLLLIYCLAFQAGLPVDSVHRILQSKNGKAVTALAWQAGLQMRTALVMQHRLATVPPDGRLNARNGIDYPLDGADLERELAFFID